MRGGATSSTSMFDRVPKGQLRPISASPQGRESQFHASVGSKNIFFKTLIGEIVRGWGFFLKCKGLLGECGKTWRGRRFQKTARRPCSQRSAGTKREKAEATKKALKRRGKLGGGDRGWREGKNTDIDRLLGLRDEWQKHTPVKGTTLLARGTGNQGREGNSFPIRSEMEWGRQLPASEKRVQIKASDSIGNCATQVSWEEGKKSVELS